MSILVLVGMFSPDVWLLCGLLEGYQKYDQGVPPQSTAGENGRFLWFVGACATFMDFMGEQNNRTFRGRDRALVRSSLLFSIMFLRGLQFRRPFVTTP